MPGSEGTPVGRVWDVQVGRVVTRTSSAGVCDENTWALLVSLTNIASHSNHPTADSLNSQRVMLVRLKKKKYPLRGGVGWQSHPMVSLEYPLCSEKKTGHWKVKWLAQGVTALPQKS